MKERLLSPQVGKMNPEMAMVVRRNEEREALRSVIAQWNANRLDLFELSEPNQDLEFHGVMRFYFQDSGQKVATKCIRVASDATAQVVIETLIEKFRPDMRMLSVPEYALYEIHENGEERRLEPEEKPLLVQLNWHKDDREGRFLLRRIDDKTNMPEGTFQEGGSSFRRKLSKREKKQLKKQEKLNRMKSAGLTNDENDAGVAEKLYTELPETSFTRSISNPEAVMRRRRQQKLERKLQQFRSKDGGPDTGGTLKIYGEALCRDVPYKTLLLSIGDTATQVVKEMLMKYGLDKEEPQHYCLVQVNTAIEENQDTNHSTNTLNQREYILDDDECPLAILMNHPLSRGSIMFHVRRRPADYHPRKRKKKPLQGKWGQSNELLDYRYEDGLDRLPFFLELNPDGSEVGGGTGKRYRLQPNVTEVGSERGSPHGHGQSLQLFGPNIQPRHCVIAHTEGIVTVTPCSRDAETHVNGQRIYETTILQNGATVRFGKIHNFRFLDPCYEERTRQRYDSSRSPHDYAYDRQSTREETSSLSVGNGPTTTSTPSGNPLNYETTFDVDGNVETRSTSSQGNKEETRSQRSIGSSREGNNRVMNYERYPRGADPILPAVLEIREETEEALLHALITDLDPNGPGFKLAPAYTLYLMARYRASTHYRPELNPMERAQRLTLILARVAAIIHSFIQDRRFEVRWLALWLANASEVLHFLKSDRHISGFSVEAQETLADAVQIAFKHLVTCLQGELSAVMPNFLSDRDDLSHDPEDSSTASVLGVLSGAMNLLRRCRVNAALTIQLFSQLFHYVNVWAFNKIVAPGTGYCSRQWGLRIKARLAQVEVWAERQGLELAADCHLARIMQAAHLLQAPKYNCDDLATLSSTCFKLNSLQLRALLQNYQPTPDEPRIPHDIVENVVRVAENLADELARSDGREVRLEEDAELALPFLLPDDGYSCEVVRGVPPGLVEFLSPLQAAGLCRLTAQPTSNGLWTVYMGVMTRSPSAMSNRSSGFVPTQHEPEVQIIKLHKSNNGMGLSIVAAKGAGQDRLGIYIKSVVKGGAADADGRLQAGDQLLKVDGQSLVGITQEKAAEYLVRTGPIVTLEVAKQGAIYHGLATLLSQPSPVMTRAYGSQIPHLNQEVNQQNFPKSVSMGNFCEQRHFDYSIASEEFFEPVRPGSPTVVRLAVPIITMTPPLPPSNPIIIIPPANLLNVPQNNVNCYKVPPESEFNLREDVFQEHQARLMNCDSEDASASLQRVLPKVDFVRTPEDREEKSPPDWFIEKMKRTKETYPSQWVPIKNARSWKSDIYLSKNGEWEFNEDAEFLFKRRSVSLDCILDTSSSECDCMINSQSPQSTDSQAEVRSVVQNCVDEDQEYQENEFVSRRKLSNEEREKALKELDEIVSGIGRITAFANKDLTIPEPEAETINPMNNFLSSMLAEPDPLKTENYIPKIESSSSPSSSNDGDFEYGTGRVAALAKHFSQMGEAGIIRGMTNYKKGMTRGNYKSEPNIAVSDSEMSPRPGDIILPPAAFIDDTALDNCNLVLGTKGLKPVGFSMDRLIDLGHGVIMRESKCDLVQLENDKVAVHNTHNQNDCNKLSIVDEIILDKSTQTSPLKIEIPRSKELSLSESALHDKEKEKNVATKIVSLPEIHLVLPEPPKLRPPRMSLTRKSISVDEVEIRRKSQASSPKHYSLVDLGDVDKIETGWLENKEVLKTDSPTKFCASERIHKAYIGDSNGRCMKRWMSVDDAGYKTAGWSERLKEKDRLDFGTTKDTLRKKCKADVIKGRKLKRVKKLELQRSFVVTPVRLCQVASLDNCNTFWCKPTAGCQPQLEIGSNGPRRMSERDLPSRVLSEQQSQQGRGQLPPHPQIHSSKSVPSLNTGNHEFERPNLNQTTIASSTMPHPNHEVFNPGYSRTSSTNSIPQKSYESQPHQNSHQIRSRSSQNLAEHRQTNTLPPNHIGQRQPSNPNLIPNNYSTHHPPYQQPPYQPQQPSPVGENGERFYQNLSIYRNQEVVHNGHGPPPPQNGFGRGKMPSPQEDRTPAPQMNFRGSQSSLQSRSTEPARDRPSSAYLPNNYPSHLMPQNRMQGRSQSSRDMLRQEAKFQEISEELRRREMRSPHHNRPQGAPNQPIQGSPLRYPGYAEQGYRMAQPEYAESPPPPPPPPTSTHPLYQSQQPLPQLRGDMRTEMRPDVRGEMRPDMRSEMRPDMRGEMRPDMRAEMRPDVRAEMRPDLRAEIRPDVRAEMRPDMRAEMRPDMRAEMRPDTRNDINNENRYAASGGEPPRGSYYASGPGSQPASRQYLYQASNPWQRAEREKEAERRRDAARHWRDQQIAELSSLPQRNPQQDEQLRALKLEREFEKRAEELEEEDEEDQDTAERVQGLLRVAQQNDEKRNMRTTQSGVQPQLYTNNVSTPPQQQLPQQQQQQHYATTPQQQFTTPNSQHSTPSSQHYSTNSAQLYTSTAQYTTATATPTTQQYVSTPPSHHTPQMNGTIGRPPPVNAVSSNYQPVSAEEKARLQRLKDLKMKQAEVEAERIKKRVEEEARSMSNNYQSSSRPPPVAMMNQNTATLRNPSTLRLDNLVINSPSNNNHYHNNNGYSSSQASPGGQTGNGNSTVAAPQPPERGSSFAVAQSLRSPPTPTLATAKRVSFQDPPPPANPPPPPSSLSEIREREDPNNFINEAENMLSSPTSPDTPFTGNTPGVIGAQEVYKDPRQRRLAEQQKMISNNKAAAVPEKLSFKEKMKMFAMETGEDGTPRDKVKISRAQRDIDNIGSPGTPNNNQ